MSKFELSDEQCLTFRQMRGNFNHMVRAIYQAGVNAALEEAAKVADEYKVYGLNCAEEIRGMKENGIR